MDVIAVFVGFFDVSGDETIKQAFANALRAQGRRGPRDEYARTLATCANLFAFRVPPLVEPGIKTMLSFKVGEMGPTTNWQPLHESMGFFYASLPRIMQGGPDGGAQ